MHAKRKIRIQRGLRFVEAEVDALDFSTPLEPIIDACMDDNAIVRATELSRRYVDARASWGTSAVYVIGPSDIPICKVGNARSPSHRLIGLQIGNWHQLKIHGLIWIESGVEEVEQLAQKASKEIGIHLRGEWMEATPREAMELAVKAARYSKLVAYDSGIWMKNWGARMEPFLHESVKKRILQKFAA